MCWKTATKVRSRGLVDFSAAQNIGEDNRVKKEVRNPLPTNHQHGIEKTMPQPFKLFLDLLRDGLFHLIVLFSSCERIE